jgi:hypothetical protein
MDGGVHGSLAGASEFPVEDEEDGVTTSTAEYGSDTGFDSCEGTDGTGRLACSAKMARIALRFSCPSS